MWVRVNFSKPELESLKFGQLRSPACRHGWRMSYGRCGHCHTNFACATCATQTFYHLVIAGHTNKADYLAIPTSGHNPTCMHAGISYYRYTYPIIILLFSCNPCIITNLWYIKWMVKFVVLMIDKSLQNDVITLQRKVKKNERTSPQFTQP